MRTVNEFLSFFFFFSSRRRHTRCLSDWSSDVCSSDLSFSVTVRRSAPFTPIARGKRVPSVCRRFQNEVHQNDQCRRRFRQLFARGLWRAGRDLQARRSEERRVGKEGRSRGAAYHLKKKKKKKGGEGIGKIKIEGIVSTNSITGDRVCVDVSECVLNKSIQRATRTRGVTILHCMT